MVSYNKQKGVWLPTNVAEPEPVIATVEDLVPPPIKDPEPPKVEEKPYYHEIDDDEIDWYVCNKCTEKRVAYNSESVAKRHQTLKHK